jgi:O-antigen/teichoic acid export membrane protein
MGIVPIQGGGCPLTSWLGYVALFLLGSAFLIGGVLAWAWRPAEVDAWRAELGAKGRECKLWDGCPGTWNWSDSTWLIVLVLALCSAATVAFLKLGYFQRRQSLMYKAIACVWVCAATITWLMVWLLPLHDASAYTTWMWVGVVVGGLSVFIAWRIAPPSRRWWQGSDPDPCACSLDSRHGVRAGASDSVHSPYRHTQTANSLPASVTRAGAPDSMVPPLLQLESSS